jgi:hypothetical protein
MIIVVLVLAVEFLSASVRKSILGGDTFADRRILQRIRLTRPSCRRPARTPRARRDERSTTTSPRSPTASPFDPIELRRPGRRSASG